MASLQHKNVMSQKFKAIKTFYTNFEYIFHFFYVFVTLFLFYHSSFFSFTLRSFSHLHALFISYFNNSFFAFLLLNAIILFLFILSDRNGDVSVDTYNQCLKITASPELVTGDNDDQCFKITASELVTNPNPNPNPVVSLPEKLPENNSCNMEVGELFPVFEETVRAVTETTTTTCCTTVTKNGENKVSEEKCYRRVQSECYERSTVVANQRRDLKRFNTCLKKKEPEKKLCYVEELSKEEFNRTVEDFIAKHKKMQREEQLRSQKTEYLALTL